MRKIILLSVISIISISVFGQEVSNKGKDFWVGYGYHQVMGPQGNGNNGQNMVLYFATEAVTTVTVSIPGNGYTQTFANIPANTIFTTPVLPKNGGQDARLYAEGLSNRGIHIVSDRPIVAYAHIYNASVSGSCLLFPTNTLGKEYYSINYTNRSNTTDANSWFYVVATDPGITTVEIVPSANTSAGWAAGQTYTVNLTQGQVYTVKGDMEKTPPPNCNPYCSGEDLTGSRIKSIASGSGGCKRIAVYSGSGRIAISCNGTAPSSDNYMVQAVPKNSWGKKYLTASTGGNMPNNIYRVCVSDPTTVVRINGVVTALPLTNNFYYEIPATSQPLLIEADQPVVVAQYVTSQGVCGNGNPGDPEVIYLSPVEQSISNVIFNSNLLVAAMPHTHFVNVIIPNGGTAISSFRLDGGLPPGAFTVHPQEPAYSYIKIQGLTLGQHVISSDSGFNAIAYGFAAAESYGYNAGTNVIDLNQQLELNSPNGIETTPVICTGSQFGFKVYFPDKTNGASPSLIRYDSIKWNSSNTTVMTPNNFPVVVNGTPTITPDSVNVRNGKDVAWYSIPGQYSFSTPGVYDITVTVYRTSTEGCGNEQDYTFQLTIIDPPGGSFTHSTPSCYLEPVQFTETTPQSPKTTYKWFWDFGDGTPFSFAKDPQHTYALPGTYTARYAGVTTPGCVTDTINQQVIVPDVPNATINGSINVCLNAPTPSVTLTGTGGVAPYQMNYSINGVAQPAVTSNAGGIFTITGIPTNVAGTFVYSLDSLRNFGSTLCKRILNGQTATVVVRPLPVAVIAGATTVCLNGPAPTVTFTGSGATAPYTFAYTINGVAQTPVVSNGAGVATVTAPTNIAGPFTYAVTLITDASTTLCNQAYNNTVNTIVTVTPLPAASINGSATAVCLNATSPTITFVGSSGIAPYTFNYTLNGTAQTPVVSNAGGTYTLTVPTNVAGPFNYVLTSVQEGSVNACIRSNITGQSALVTVNPLPTAVIAGSTTVCVNAASPNVTFTGSGGTAPYTFAYTINGIAQTPVVSNAAGVATVAAATNVAGPLLYAITMVTDATTTLCSQTLSNVTTTVNVTPLPTASITGTNTACINGASPTITFTGNGGIAPYTFNYTINGTPQPPVISNGAGIYTIAVPTATAGPFNYALTSVQESGPNTCIRTGITGQSATITVNPLPTAVIAGGTTVCLNAASPSIIFTGGGGTAPYTFNYTLNGIPQPPVVSNASGTYIIAVPTNATGPLTYIITSVQEGSANACLQSNVTGQSATITVNPLPTAAITGSTTVCLNATQPLVTFVGSGSVAPYTFNYTINGVPQTPLVTNNTGGITVPAPTNAAGSFVYAITSVSDGTPNACSQILNNITTTITVRPLPVAAITGATAVCLNAPSPTVTFTGSGGNAPYVFTYTINGVTQAPVATNNAGVYTILVPTNTAGPVNYTLLSIQESGPYSCIQPAIVGQSAIVMVNPLPTASIAAATTNTCLNAASPNITFTGLGGTAPYTFAYTINGTPQTPVVSNNAGIAIVPAATGVANTFIYALTSVTDGSATACSQLQNGTATVVVNPLPTAIIAGNIEVCQNAAAPAVTFTGAGGTAPYTFTYSVNGAPDVTVTTTAGNSVFVLQPTTAVNTFTYVLKSVQDATASLCSQLQSGTVTVKVNPLPTAAISGSKLICINSVSPDITFTGAGGSTPYTFRYRINGGALLTATTTGTNTSVAVPVATNAAGSFTYTLEDVRDGSITACLQTQTGSAKVDISNIFPNPLFDFSDTVCLPNALVQFQNQSTIANGAPNSMTYLWNFGDGSPTSTAFQPSHRYYAVGPFNVTLQATSTAGCVTIIPIAVNSIHAQPKAAFSINKPAGVCIGEFVTLNDLSDPKDGTTSKWNWDLGDGTQLTTNPVNYKYGAASNYFIDLYTINSFGCNSDTLRQPFTVHPFPVVDAGPDGIVLEGGSYTMKPTVSGRDLQYLWSPANFLNSTTILAPTATGMLDDITYKLVVTGRGGCEAPADFVFIKVLKAPKVPNTFTPNGDGINELWLIDYLDTYPNCKVQVFTRTGQLVFESKGYKTPWNGKLNGKALPFDTYYYIIEPGNNRTPITGYVTIIK